MTVRELQRVWVTVITGAALFSALSARGGTEEEKPEMQARIFGYGCYQYGQIVKGQYAFAPASTNPVYGRLSHYSQQEVVVQLGGEVKRNNGFSVDLACQGRIYFPFALPSDGPGIGGFQCYSSFYSWTIHQAEVKYVAGNKEAPYATISAGLFPFKYNPDVRTFGDYLMRINPVPQFYRTSFDSPYASLLGICVNSTYMPFISEEILKLSHDLMLTSEIHLWPLKDYSLSYLLNTTLFKFADIGCGIMADRLFPVNDSITKPPKGDNPANFRFGGTKVMLRLAFDFKRFLPFRELWGENDWRIYSEACWNGIKNQIADTSAPAYLKPAYNDLKTRLPVVFGVNVPTCKILDVLSIEGEWWDDKYANSYWGVFNAGYAIPPNPSPYPEGVHRIDPYGGSWHWSIYAKKTIASNIRIAAQVGRDHTFIETTLTGISNGDPEEAMDGKGNWGWMAKIEYGF